MLPLAYFRKQHTFNDNFVYMGNEVIMKTLHEYKGNFALNLLL